MSDPTGDRDEFTHAVPTAKEGERSVDSPSTNISHGGSCADATTSLTLPLTFANHTTEGPRGLLLTPRSAGSLFSSPHSELAQRNFTGTPRLDRSPHFLIDEGMRSANRHLSSFTATFSSPCSVSSRGEGRHGERNCHEPSAKDLRAGGGAGMPSSTKPLVLSQFGVPHPPEAHEMSATTARSATTLRSRLGPNVTKPLSEVLGVSDASHLDGTSVDIFRRKELRVSSPGTPASYEGSGWGGAHYTKDHASPPPLAAAVPGLHTHHRTLAEPLLNDIFDFLSRVGEELKQIALLKTTEDGEFSLLGEPHHAEAAAAIANSPPYTPRARSRRAGGGSILVSRDHSKILFQPELTGERWLHRRSLDTSRSASPMSIDYLAGRFGLQSISTVAPSEMPPSTLAGYPLLNVGDLVSDENPAKQPGMDPLLPFPLYSVNNGFSFPPEWFSELPEMGNGAAAQGPQPAAAGFAGDREVVTAEPLIFRAGMLQDPISGCFLLGGAAFHEEVRVLKAKTVEGTVCHMTAATLFGQAFTQWSKASSPRTPAARPRSSKIGLNGNVPSSGGRILLREYLSVSKCGGGCVVQTLSILRDSVTVNASRHQILAPDVARRLLEDTLPGAITRLIIQPNARGMTHNQAFRPFSLCSPRPGVSDTTADRAAAFDRRQSAILHQIASIDSFRVNPHPTKSDGSSPGASNKRSDRSHIMTSSKAVRQEGSPLLQNFNTSRPSRWLSEAKRRFLVGEEATLANSNPALLEWAMHRDPSVLQESIDNIRAFLEYYRTTYATMMVVRGLLTAVRRLQAFVRRCLARKKRCVKRMLQMWRSLEVESRKKLHYYHPPSSSLERIELIASNLLEQHMITSHEYKQKLIEELWEERRQNYRAWKNEKGLDNYVRVARGPRSTITDESSLSSAVGRLSPGPPVGLQANSLARTPLDPDSELPPKRFSVTTPHEASAIELSQESCQKSEGDEAYTCEAEPHVSSTLSYKAFRMPRNVELNGPPWRRTGRALSATRVTAWVRGVRMDSEFHKRFGWYIAPEHLLYVSHQRLLESLKISILSMEQVQYEVERAANENKERLAQELRQRATAAATRRDVPGCPRLPRIPTNNSAYRRASRSVATRRSALFPKERSSVMTPISCLTENTSQLATGESQKFEFPRISNCRDRIHE